MKRLFLFCFLVVLPVQAFAQPRQVVTGCGGQTLAVGDGVNGFITTTGIDCGGGATSPVSTTPTGATASTIAAGGAANILVTGPVKGCYIVNPVTAADENIAAAETVYLNPVTTATANGRGTNSAIVPGQSFSCVPGQTTNVSGIAATTGHALNVVAW